MLSRVLALVLAGLVALPARAAPTESDRERVADEAAGHLDRGEFRDAAVDFSAYYRMLGDKRATAVGENSVLIAVDAYWRAWEAERNRADLEAARDLLVEHLDAVEAKTGARTGKAADRAAIELARVERELLQNEPTDDTPPTAATDPPPAEPGAASDARTETPPEPVAPSPGVSEPPPNPASVAVPTPDRARPRSDRVGIGLVTGGSIALAGGVALLAIGGTLVPRGRKAFDACEDCDPDLRETYLLDVRATSRPYLIAGGIAAAVGVGLLSWGIVRLVQHGRRGRAAARRWVPFAGGLAMMPRDPEMYPDPPAR